MKRRDFFKMAGIGAAGVWAGNFCCAEKIVTPKQQVKKDNIIVPSYLKGYEEVYRQNPRQAALEWFKEAKFGLFIHYGLGSSRFNPNIPATEYAKLKDKFTAEHFDADFIADLALESEMKYINITTTHVSSCGFCLFATKETDFNSVNSPAKRDLVAELAKACEKRNLGLFLYYPPGPVNKEVWKYMAEGKSNRPESPNQSEDDEVERYINFVRSQIKELLTNYGPIAGIWFDGVEAIHRAGVVSKYKFQELYDMIHASQPQVLVSLKQGLLGTEDFSAPERVVKHIKNRRKPLEICDTLQPYEWVYAKSDDGKHRTAEQVMGMLNYAATKKGNLLLNTGPLPDGSIHPEDIVTLREVGKKLRNKV